MPRYPNIQPGERVGIIGSRDWPHPEAVRELVNWLPESCTVVSGGARGVDRTAQEAAVLRGMSVDAKRPDYAAHKANPRYAPLARNLEIVNSSNVLIAFWDGTSRGTKHAIDAGQKRVFQLLQGNGSGHVLRCVTVIGLCDWCGCASNRAYGTGQKSGCKACAAIDEAFHKKGFMP